MMPKFKLPEKGAPKTKGAEGVTMRTEWKPGDAATVALPPVSVHETVNDQATGQLMVLVSWRSKATGRIVKALLPPEVLTPPEKAGGIPLPAYRFKEQRRAQARLEQDSRRQRLVEEGLDEDEVLAAMEGGVPVDDPDGRRKYDDDRHRTMFGNDDNGNYHLGD